LSGPKRHKRNQTLGTLTPSSINNHTSSNSIPSTAGAGLKQELEQEQQEQQQKQQQQQQLVMKVRAAGCGQW
jgi:hypothetical protein